MTKSKSPPSREPPAPPRPNRKPVVLNITKGATVSYCGRDYTVLSVLDLNQVLARDPASDEKVILKLGGIAPPTKLNSSSPISSGPDLEEVSQEEWDTATFRLTAIEPLVDGDRRRTRGDYRTAAKRADVHIATIYRWAEIYRIGRTLSSLLPTRGGNRVGRSRLREEVRLIIQDYIQNKYLTLQKPSAAAAAREIRRLCSNAKLKPLPAVTTVYRHLGWLSEQERLKRREGTKVAREKFAVHKGSIPDSNWPLAMTQMDHTLLPVMIVDDVHRLPIGRPWITLIIDVFSRVCLGMYLTLDSPSAMSAGMCIAHAILNKDTWMNRIGCGDIEWPFYGVMDVLHMDNAREFRGNMLRAGAKEYNIDLHLRPVKVPHYGAHIERFMGTVSQGLKELPGTTFSNPKQRGIYKSEGNAFMTFDELEKWLVLFFAQYHRDIHTCIGTTPLAKWKEGILGTKSTPGRGLPPIRSDGEKLRIDFMPYEERTVQDHGVVIDQIHYFSDVLRPWMNARDIENSKLKRKFKFRFDPRDISALYFFDPNAGRYFQIPYRDSSLPPVSVWEIRAAKKQFRDTGMAAYDERAIFELINRRRELEDASAAKSKAARKERQKRTQHAKARKVRSSDLPTVSVPESGGFPSVLQGYNPSEIRPLDDDD